MGATSFAFLIKEELITKKMAKAEILAFIDGMLYASFIDADKPLIVSFKNKQLLTYVLELLKQSSYTYLFNGMHISFPETTKLNFIKAHNASAFLAGVFVVAGSISKLNSSSYHLQMSCKNALHLQRLIDFSAKHIPFNSASNKNQFIMYIKRHELIEDFLYIIGAQNCYFQFLEAVIERDHRYQITRISNLDIHNQSRLVESNEIFLEQWNFIEAHNLQDKFTREQLLFFNFKKNHPFLPLSQIVEELVHKYQIVKTKGGLNHWLIKLRNVYEQFYKKSP